MSREPPQSAYAAIRTLTRQIRTAGDPKLKRIVATVDAMTQRGQADLLIEPMRQRLARIRPPRPLRFGRLLFHPLDLLIVPTARWRTGQHVLPRTALIPMADHVALTMGAAGTAIKAQIAGRTTHDTELISHLGQSLWPAAATILADSAIPATWHTTEMGQPRYRPLANAAAALLAEAATVDTLRAEAATGLLSPRPEVIEAILRRVAANNIAALPMLIAVLLERLPEAADLLPSADQQPIPAATQAAIDSATEVLLRQLDRESGMDIRIAAGTLAEAGAATRRLAALLTHLETANATPQRRKRVHAVRQRLEALCTARFAAGLQDELLTPLQSPGTPPADVSALEAAARGLRVLEIEARVLGGGPAYDRLLDSTAAVIGSDAVLETISRADQLRLVEIIRGPDAAMAMLVRSA